MVFVVVDLVGAAGFTFSAASVVSSNRTLLVRAGGVMLALLELIKLD